MLPDERPSPEQIAILRAKTPAERWRIAKGLYWMARRHKAAFLKSLHPDCTEIRIEEEVRRVFSNART
jgi:hypothetical protein